MNVMAALGLCGWRHEGLWPSALIDGRAHFSAGQTQELRTPIDGASLGQFMPAPRDVCALAVAQAEKAFLQWRSVPAPRRGELVRRIGEVVRQHKAELAELVTLEAGKIRSEAEGEVQEWIDICDYAVGLSRQLGGLTLASERPAHRLMEQWHPLGPVGVITAFNFPLAVWAWNAMLAFVCGDTVVWKPSEKTPLCALAAARMVTLACESCQVAPGLLQIVLGLHDCGESLAADRRLPLISATGSVGMGRAVAQTVAARLGRTLLELGGNNAAIVTPSADLALTLRAVTFSAAGTCGQRCTTLRRLLVHQSRKAPLLEALSKTYAQLKIGDPRQEGVLVGPLIDGHAWHAMQAALRTAESEGGRLVCGGERLGETVPGGGYYVRPAIVDMPAQSSIVREETFAPILYVLNYQELPEAIAFNNAVTQGLSSAIFTQDLREAEYFLSAQGSDCGIANVNAGTSGAEIGGAFGGEKETGGGRESGSDAWKNYMRRSTNTINYGTDLPLAQGINFGS